MSLCLLLLTKFQKNDLKSVVDHLRKDGNVSMIGLWGRSMGAVTRLVLFKLFLKALHIFGSLICLLIAKTISSQSNVWSGRSINCWDDS